MKKSKPDTDYYKLQIEDGVLHLNVLMPLIYSNSEYFRSVLSEIGKIKDISKIEIDFSLQDNFDTYLIIFSQSVEKYCIEQNIRFEIINSNPDINSVVILLKSPPAEILEPKPKKSYLYRHFEEIGYIVIKIVKDTYNFISFFGELFIRFLTLIFKPSRLRWEDMPLHFTQSGVMALPITLVIVFLLGMITGYQGALQLKQFGADMFIADLVGISLTRELSPLMVAILVAGRSGSAFAAELGTMKVSEEIDALTTMGFDKFEFLVLPRVMSVTLAMPFLVIICNIVGILGGLIAATSTLDITFSGYIGRMQMALSLWDIGSGLIKSIVFGFLISALGCYKGLNVQGGADAVGRYTTSSVVAGVFLIILADALFTFIFQALGV
ncbi:MAG: ABC transporter permease [Candidatus Kapabacteria bacterium]|nr:ABC transporter permease [Ignavibacteriota bacterium]MCW5883470.1 ABC transporter permease [Candidatus Kapabacteria bacterium]